MTKQGKGTFFIPREVIETWIFEDVNLLKIYIWLYERARWESTHKENKPVRRKMGRGIKMQHLDTGQLIYGRKKAVEALCMSESKIRRRLDSLEKAGLITRQSLSNYSIITINEYADYQRQLINRQAKPRKATSLNPEKRPANKAPVMPDNKAPQKKDNGKTSSLNPEKPPAKTPKNDHNIIQTKKIQTNKKEGGEEKTPPGFDDYKKEEIVSNAFYEAYKQAYKREHIPDKKSTKEAALKIYKALELWYKDKFIDMGLDKNKIYKFIKWWFKEIYNELRATNNDWHLKKFSISHISSNVNEMQTILTKPNNNTIATSYKIPKNH